MNIAILFLRSLSTFRDEEMAIDGDLTARTWWNNDNNNNEDNCWLCGQPRIGAQV